MIVHSDVEGLPVPIRDNHPYDRRSTGVNDQNPHEASDKRCYVSLKRLEVHASIGITVA